MNRRIIIGNGFDMAHGLKTSYMDFINWYWEQRLSTLLTENTSNCTPYKTTQGAATLYLWLCAFALTAR